MHLYSDHPLENSDSVSLQSREKTFLKEQVLLPSSLINTVSPQQREVMLNAHKEKLGFP